jgi:hypothetical protein
MPVRYDLFRICDCEKYTIINVPKNRDFWDDSKCPVWYKGYEIGGRE